MEKKLYMQYLKLLSEIDMPYAAPAQNAQTLGARIGKQIGKKIEKDKDDTLLPAPSVPDSSREIYEDEDLLEMYSILEGKYGSKLAAKLWRVINKGDKYSNKMKEFYNRVVKGYEDFHKKPPKKDSKKK